VVTQSGVIPAQRNRAPPYQVVADAAFLDLLKIGLKVLTQGSARLRQPFQAQITDLTSAWTAIMAVSNGTQQNDK